MLVDRAVAVADGATTISEIAVLAEQHTLFRRGQPGSRRFAPRAGAERSEACSRQRADLLIQGPRALDRRTTTSTAGSISGCHSAQVR